MPSLIGQQSGLAKAKPLSMHNKSLIGTVAAAPRAAVISRACPAAAKGFAR